MSQCFTRVFPFVFECCVALVWRFRLFLHSIRAPRGEEGMLFFRDFDCLATSTVTLFHQKKDQERNSEDDFLRKVCLRRKQLVGEGRNELGRCLSHVQSCNGKARWDGGLSLFAMCCDMSYEHRGAEIKPGPDAYNLSAILQKKRLDAYFVCEETRDNTTTHHERGGLVFMTLLS